MGFRPFIYNLASRHGLTGYVSNTSDGVVVEAEGSDSSVRDFLKGIEVEAPPLSVITEIGAEDIPAVKDIGFVIEPSDGKAAAGTLISPDVAVCDDCLEELFHPDDRRYLYPFINCTNCGPRYTIIESIPYDRPYTSMKSFHMCEDCQKEYNDPENRRFHAQPNACPVCGPVVSLHDEMGNLMECAEPIMASVELLKKGKIVAIKGLGGFHLTVDAFNYDAVRILRERKGREEKPLAVMAANIEAVRSSSLISKAEENALLSFSRPILLVRKNDSKKIAESVAPGNDRLGVMLPYTPLHHILFHYGVDMLVMTSANYAEEPICIDNDEAIHRLRNIADYFLVHDRDIYFRNDDSVLVFLSGELRQVRRSRGYVPRPVFVNSEGPTVLAVGGELKNTICLLKNDQAFLSQHIGDLENLDAFEFFRKTVKHLKSIFETEPELIVYDLHPSYLSTQWAKEQSEVKTLGVQHHHAHLASCMAENKLEHPVIGIIMDGTGYGTDGIIWGGEFLVGDYESYERKAHFEPVPLPGGDAAIKAPWRTAVSYLHHSFDGDLPDLPFLGNHDVSPIVEMISKNINSPHTTSCGRLFDAVAAMSGGKQEIKYEAQAAIEFMQCVGDIGEGSFEYRISKENGSYIMMVSPLIRSAVNMIQNGVTIGDISAAFHRTLIELFTETAIAIQVDTNLSDIILSGGAFQNHILFEGLLSSLRSLGFNVYTHSRVPTNDGGLSLGQALIGRNLLIASGG